MSVVLEARAVAYRSGERWLVEDVDLTLESGSLTVVVGPNGAGKSTLLRLLSGELSPSHGEVLLGGRSVGAIAAWQLAHARAVMPQSSDLGLPFTALEVASLGVEGIGKGLTRNDRQALVRDALERADVAHLACRDYQTLSGGERQRVHFARVLAQLRAGQTVETRQVLFLDEPIASLDLKHQLALLHEARRLAEAGLAVLAVLHDLQLAAGVGGHLVLMRDGRIVACGASDAVLSPERLKDVFGVSLTQPCLPAYPWQLAGRIG